MRLFAFVCLTSFLLFGPMLVGCSPSAEQAASDDHSLVEILCDTPQPSCQPVYEDA